MGWDWGGVKSVNGGNDNMATARKVLVDPTVTPFNHCISWCVRRAFLGGEENAHRKLWIEERLKELVGIFAIDVCGIAIVDNH